jgi:hypothetical protein
MYSKPLPEVIRINEAKCSPKITRKQLNANFNNIGSADGNK